MVINAKEAWEAIKNGWAERVKAQHFEGKELADRQAEFFAGAMSAMVAAGYPHDEAMPPSVVISCMTGRDTRTGEPIEIEDEDEDRDYYPAEAEADDPYSERERLYGIIPRHVADFVVGEMVENWPEASLEHECTRWDYKGQKFRFETEDGEVVRVDKDNLRYAFRKLILGGGYPALPVNLSDKEAWNGWLCQCDADQFSALAEYAVDHALAASEQEAGC